MCWGTASTIFERYQKVGFFEAWIDSAVSSTVVVVVVVVVLVLVLVLVVVQIEIAIFLLLRPFSHFSSIFRYAVGISQDHRSRLLVLLVLRV